MGRTQWAPPAAGVGAMGAAGLAMGIASATVVADTPGRIMAGIAAAGLVVFAGLTWRARPKLAITPDGLALRGWFGTQVLRPSDIRIIRINEFRRHARTVRLLELETVAGSLVLFSRWDLGTNPLTVLDALTEAGYAGRKAR
ncbi:MAG: PH domain-containing protein [Mycobacterium sp.]